MKLRSFGIALALTLIRLSCWEAGRPEGPETLRTASVLASKPHSLRAFKPYSLRARSCNPESGAI